MITIWKFPLATVGEQVISIPHGFNILTVREQNNAPVLWASVDDRETSKANIKILTYGTGAPIPQGQEGVYVGTYMLDDGEFVGHVFYGYSV